jgi:chromosome segregation ATPase
MVTPAQRIAQLSAALEGDKAALEARVETLEREKGVLQRDKAALEARVETLEREKTAVVSDNAKLQREKAMDKRAKEAAQSEVALLKATIERITQAATDARSALERMLAGSGAA